VAKFARVTRFEDSPERLSAAIEQFRKDLAPIAKRLPGCEGTYLFVDKETGRGMAITLWRTEEAMLGGEDIAKNLRRQAATEQHEAGLTLWSVEHYEVAVE
jgi:heme-degrading monooxygenase HmoA